MKLKMYYESQGKIGRVVKDLAYQNKFPTGWDEKRVKRVLEHYETQSEDEAVAEDEAAYEDTNQTFMEIPNELIPVVRELIAKKTELTPNV